MVAARKITATMVKTNHLVVMPEAMTSDRATRPPMIRTTATSLVNGRDAGESVFSMLLSDIMIQPSRNYVFALV